MPTTGTLFDYPTYTLKNLAKEYNIHYYIKDIERLSKAALVDAILKHVEWMKASESVKNKIQFEKSLAEAPTNYEKDSSGFYKQKPGRMNIKQIEKGLEKKEEKPPTPPTPPAYKGQKGVTKAVANLVEKVVKEQTSQAQLLHLYHELAAPEQLQFRDAIGIEAKPLPKGVPALGEHTDREIAVAINDFQEENAPGIAKVPPPRPSPPPLSPEVQEHRLRVMRAIAAKSPGGPAAAYLKAKDEGYTGTYAEFRTEREEKKAKAEAPVAPIPKEPEAAPAAPLQAKKRILKLKASSPYPKLAELEAKAVDDHEHSPRRFYIALAKLLIADNKMGQGPLGRKLAEMGFSGTTQSNISQKISQMRDMGLLKPMNKENGYYPLVA